MPDMSISYPEELLITSGKSPQDLEAELVFLLAVKLYELRRLSLGKAAEFCHMNKIQFMFEHGCATLRYRTNENPGNQPRL